MEGIVDAYFDKYFRYHKKELVAIDDLNNEWAEGRNQYIKMCKRLKERKELLFKEGQMDKWEIRADCPYPIDVLRKEKDIAFAEMLPNDTRELARYQRIHGYYTNKVPEEYERVCKKNSEELREHIIKVAKLHCDLYARVFLFC